MTLYDLADNVQYAVLHAVNCGIDPKNVTVGVEILPEDGKIYGGTPVDNVVSANRGFDWDSYVYIIKTEGDLTRRDKQ